MISVRFLFYKVNVGYGYLLVCPVKYEKGRIFKNSKLTN